MDPPPSSPSTPVLPSWQSTDYTVQMCVTVSNRWSRIHSGPESNGGGFVRTFFARTRTTKARLS